MTAPELCKHCGRVIEPDPTVGLGWRHAAWFISCHPGRPETPLAEPALEEVSS